MSTEFLAAGSHFLAAGRRLFRDLGNLADGTGDFGRVLSLLQGDISDLSNAFRSAVYALDNLVQRLASLFAKYSSFFNSLSRFFNQG